MVSVGTQTPWSWLSDSRDLHPACKLPPVHTVAITSTMKDDKHEAAHQIPNVSSNPRTRSSRGETLEEELSLPNIVAPGSVKDELNVTFPDISEPMMLPPREDGVGGRGEETSVPLLVSQLSGLEFPSDLSSGSSSEDEEEQNMEDEEIPPPYPEVQADQLSWPAILQYLRESESEASKYFSLDKKNPNHREMKREPVNSLGVKQPSQGQEGGFRNDSSVGEADYPVVKRMSRECYFCGHEAPQWSVLHATTGAGEGMSPPEACCCQFKEYCVLVTACLQKMITERASEQPTRISVIPKHKEDVKKTAEEKALALMKRKKQWEELQLRRKRKKNKTLQSSSFYSLTKQTKIIQFSLVSQAVLSTDWMVEEKGREERRGGGGRKEEKKKGTRRKGKGKTELGNLPENILEMLKKTTAPPRALEVRTYANTQPFYTVLPDNTGQCFYPSGSVAVLIYRHIPGVLSYLIFEDRGSDGQRGSLLCCTDELGRAFCYNPDSSLRLQLRVNGEGVMYSTRGEVKKKWRWGEDMEEEERGSMVFQPLSLSLNKNLLLQWSGMDQLLVTFSVGQQRLKLAIPRKLKESSIPEDVPVLGHTENYQHFLSLMQTRLKHLLAILGGTRRRNSKLSEPQVVGGFKSGHSQRPRSRSTGTVNFTTHYPGP